MKGILNALSVLCVIIILGQGVNGQDLQRCGSDELRKSYLSTHTEYAAIQKLIEERIQQYRLGTVSKRVVITIPVVVHVVHDGDAVGVSENISEAQVLSQIAVLNEDFRKLNGDVANTPTEFIGLAADVEVEFCLAQRDPNNDPTNGIDRIKGTRFSYSADQLNTEIKPIYNWPADEYLNIYTIRLGGPQASVLGFSSFPGQNAAVDGVAIGYQFFGTTGNIVSPFNLGRTTTHEVGHWLGLEHVWGANGSGCGGTDNINDTPNQNEPYYGCPNYPRISCGSNDMFMNYMDYVDDNCMNLFTADQKTRMLAVLNTTRTGILTSEGCVPAPVFPLDIAVDEIIFPTDDICVTTFQPKIKFSNRGLNTVTSIIFNYQINGGFFTQFSWSGNILPGESQYVLLAEVTIASGVSDIQIWAASPNGGTDGKTSNNQLDLTFQATDDFSALYNLPGVEGFDITNVLPNDWITYNPDNDRTWVIDTAVGNGGANGNSVMFDNFTQTINDNPSGKLDALFTPSYDLQGQSFPRVSFNVAYARVNNNSQDSLRLYFTVDCGANWSQIWSSGGEELATAANTNSFFVPQASEWKSVMVGLDERVGDMRRVNFIFENVSDGGNNIYLDDVQIMEAPVGIEQLDNDVDLVVYPNPSNGRFDLKLNMDKPQEVSLRIFNTIGQSIYQKELGFIQQVNESISLPTSEQGLYILEISDGVSQHYTKLIIH